MDKKLLKNLGIALGAVLFFLVLSYAFVPQVLDGKIVNQSDISGYIGMSHEMSEWNATHPDDPTYWTDAMFGGMPTTAISTQNGGDATQGIYNLLLTGKRPATYLFIALLGAFLLMLSLGISWPLAIGGAIAVAFCSYNFQIIQVGHNTKMQAIAFFPWVLAALVYTLAILVLLFALVEFIDILVRKDKDSLAAKTVRKTRLTRFFIASALLLVVGGVGIATNVNKLLPLAKYTPNTMRGGSELTQDGAVKGGGLDLDYATAWSYGWEELPNLMIPNFNGGSSAQAVDPAKSETIKLLKRAGQTGTREIAKALPLYWGPQPFTAGPMYMGAITVFLFVLGLFLYKGKEKWWLIAGTVIAVLMAVGSHFMAFTKLCFHVLPLYNKFRTVSMALVVLQVTLPVLGFLTLDHIVKDGYDRKSFLRKSAIAFALTGGLCLLFFLIPTLAGDFSSAADAGQQDVLVEAFQADRIALLRQDALMSFFLIAATWGFLLWAGLRRHLGLPAVGRPVGEEEPRPQGHRQPRHLRAGAREPLRDGQALPERGPLHHPEGLQETLRRADGGQAHQGRSGPLLPRPGPLGQRVQFGRAVLPPQERRRLFPGQAPALPGPHRPLSDGRDQQDLRRPADGGNHRRRGEWHAGHAGP